MIDLLRRKGKAVGGEAMRIETPSPALSLPLIESYRAGLYEVRISRREGRSYYSASLVQEVAPYIPAATGALTALIEEKWVPPSRPGNLGDLLYQVGASVAPVLAGLGVNAPVAMAEVVAYQFVGLPTMQPFFEDDLVDEMYLDSPHSTLYLDHRQYGRCDTFVFLSRRELKALQTHLEMFCGESPSLERPTVKGELQAGRLRLRIGIDTPPLALNGESVHIRKVGARPFTLPQLVFDGTMGIEEAAFLAACLVGSVNITIVGPSGSGKTSLLNALDVAAPPEYRRIYVEDAVESLDLASYGFHQSKLRVPPIESEMDDGANKSLEVLKSLHKTPDLLILGEIQSEGHSKAMFQALSSGIRGLQTYHASGPEQALRRWTQMQGIAKVQLADLGVLVTLLRPDPLSSKRFVTRISQVNRETLQVEDVFSSNPPFEVRSRGMEVSSSKAARDIDAARGTGWFATVYADCEKRLRRAMEQGAMDIGGFLDVYWGVTGGVGNEAAA